MKYNIKIIPEEEGEGYIEIITLNNTICGNTYDTENMLTVLMAKLRLDCDVEYIREPKEEVVYKSVPFDLYYKDVLVGDRIVWENGYTGVKTAFNTVEVFYIGTAPERKEFVGIEHMVIGSAAFEGKKS
jgi:hypothetical protein